MQECAFLSELIQITMSFGIFPHQVMGDGEEQGVVKIADFGLARIYQAPLKSLSENGVGGIFLLVMHVPVLGF